MDCNEVVWLILEKSVWGLFESMRDDRYSRTAAIKAGGGLRILERRRCRCLVGGGVAFV